MSSADFGVLDSASPGAVASERSGATARGAVVAQRVRDYVEATFASFPWRIDVRDWRDGSYTVGGEAPHWSGEPLVVDLKREEAGSALLSGDPMRFLARYLGGQVDLEGNLYLLPAIREHAILGLRVWRSLPNLVWSAAFQNISRARSNVKSHYDIPQRALEVYLDQSYRAYSCGMFENPRRIDRGELLRVGTGRSDDFDSLEKSQWRKFQDAVDYITPGEGDELLDVGCGYSGQLAVALESHAFRRYVGWTHSSNQIREGARRLARFPRDRWELNEGDYRSDHRVYDHVTSTGMISHVGPRGLVPYVRNIRRRIKKGGRYVHHALMKVRSPTPLDLQIGPAFNKRYVWPGFHWFTLGEHVTALEQNGFELQRSVNLSAHYAKTTAAWYERMMSQRDVMIENLGDPTFRAWRLYLAGSSGDFAYKGIHVYRLYCEAV